MQKSPPKQISKKIQTIKQKQQKPGGEASISLGQQIPRAHEESDAGNSESFCTFVLLFHSGSTKEKVMEQGLP